MMMVHQKIICFVGPTGSQKSHLALQLSQSLNFSCALLSADAFQVYQAINVGVNKPSPSELAQLPHYFVNYCQLTDSWDIKKFQDLAVAKLQTLHAAKILPLVCGGSHLYVDALVNGYNLNKSAPRDERVFAALTTSAIYEELAKQDLVSAQKIGPQNRRRLIRALEIVRATGFKKSLLDQQTTPIYDVRYVVCNPPRDVLYAQLNARTVQMFNNGWVNEVATLLKEYPNFLELHAARALGYQYIAKCLLARVEIDLSKIQQEVRHLAKRQITWCRHHYINHSYWYNPLVDSFKDLHNWLQTFLETPSC